MTGAVDRALKNKLHAIDTTRIGEYLKMAELLEAWLSGVNELAHALFLPAFANVSQYHGLLSGTVGESPAAARAAAGWRGTGLFSRSRRALH